jgi:deoxyribonuclease (pyrimidine dimer)
MTRINVGIPVKELTTKHLIAEHREIKRIPNSIKSGKAVLRGIPEKFTLGTGHVKFFYNKLGYLFRRYELLYDECIARGYQVQYYGDAWSGIDQKLMGDFEPTEDDVKLIKQRIYERNLQTTGGPT